MTHKPLAFIFALTFAVIFVCGSTRGASVAAQSTQDVVFGPARDYVHKSGWFSVSTPQNWKVTDSSADGEVIVLVMDPTENGVLVVRVFEPKKGYTQAELGDYLTRFLNAQLGTFDGFTMGALKSQKDGSLGLYFKYNSVIGNAKYKMYGDAFIEQHNGLIGFLTLIMPEDQYVAKQKNAYNIVNSFRITRQPR